MNKFFVRLLVAATCFALSLSLTNLSKLVRGQVSAIDVVTLEAAESNLALAEDEIQLRQIYREYGPAQTQHDQVFFERIETDDFRLFCDGVSLSKEEDIQWMKSMPASIVYESYPEYISIFGNSAVVHGRMDAHYSNDHVERWDFIDVWVKRGNRWQIRHTTTGY
ncbi:MAG TPA: nuclear transport factor 2 family protein [Pyrinomonadaceae bacterium]|nr:nuclear transport factor 2 family protein [Pyrinomonadaceae bacterium]